MATDDTKPAEHPAPWRYQETNGLPTLLLDTNGAEVIGIADDSEGGYSYLLLSPLARELIRLAPELETILRVPRVAAWCPSCGGRLLEGFHAPDCRLSAILAALDAARKGTT